MRIVITGSSGKIGSAIAAELLAAGHTVVGADIKPSSLFHAHFEHRTVDLANPDEAPHLVKGADALVHMASFPSFKPEHRVKGFINNAAATYGVIAAAFDAGVRKIVNASSIQAYGAFGDLITPPAYLPIDEQHPLQPRNAYPLSKSTSEEISLSFTRRDPALSIISFRLTWVFSPSEILAVGGPMQSGTNALWTAVSTADVARAARLALDAKLPGHTPLNIVSPRSTHLWTEALIQQAYGVIPPFKRPVKPEESLITWQKAQEVIGFTAQDPVLK